MKTILKRRTDIEFLKEITDGFLHARDLLSGAIKNDLTRVGIKRIQGVEVKYVKNLNKEKGESVVW